MNSFRLNDVCATNEQRPGGQGRGAAVSETTGIGGAHEKDTNTSFSHASPGRSTGDVPCLADIQTFVGDRQRMLRSWRLLQRHLPPNLLRAEEQATVSAMRQLRQLCQEGACHEQG